MAFELPPTLAQLVEDINSGVLCEGELTGYPAARAFGATLNCATCGKEVVNPRVFTETALKHYNERDPVSRLLLAVLIDSGLEVGDLAGGKVCSEHITQYVTPRFELR